MRNIMVIRLNTTTHIPSQGQCAGCAIIDNPYRSKDISFLPPRILRPFGRGLSRVRRHLRGAMLICSEGQNDSRHVDLSNLPSIPIKLDTAILLAISSKDFPVNCLSKSSITCGQSTQVRYSAVRWCVKDGKRSARGYFSVPSSSPLHILYVKVRGRAGSYFNSERWCLTA